MAYIGHSPTNAGTFYILDDLTIGSGTTYGLAVGGVSVSPSADNLLITLDGVIQHPGDAYTISGSNIVFESGPGSGVEFYGIIMGQSASTGQGSIGADELKVSGDGSSGQVLVSDGDGTFSWATDTEAYVPLAGGTMTGTLAMGSNNITGTGTIGGTLTTASQTAITSVGTLTSLATSGNVSLDNSGSLTRMTIENNTESNILFTLGGASKGQLYADSNGISIRSESSVPLLFKTNGNTTALTLGTDQSATFAGFLNDTKIYNHLKFVASDGTTVHGGVRGASNSVEIRTGASTTVACTFDGSQNATFAGDVKLSKHSKTAKLYISGDGTPYTSSAYYTTLEAEGDRGIDIRSQSVQRFYVDNADTLALTLDASKNATFAGNILGNGRLQCAVSLDATFAYELFNSHSTGHGLKIRGGSTGSHYSLYVADYNQSNALFYVMGDGSATFAGQVTATGIKFDANGEVLDDYEEGYTEFSSGYTNGGGGTSTFNGNYDVIAWTRIGRIVHVQAMLIGSGYTGSDGEFRIGLPFVVKGHGGALTFRAANAFHISGGGDGDFYTIATRTEDVSYATVVKSGVGADTTVNSSHIGSNRVQFSLTYMTT